MKLAAVLLVILALASPAPRKIVVGGEAPVSVICDMEEQPDEHGDVLMKFELANYTPFAVDRIWLRVFEPDWDGFETSAPAVDELDAPIAASGTVVRTESVKAPPGFRMLKFSTLACIVAAVRFADGTQWQARAESPQ